jgi:hypothetical protein
LTDRDHPAIYCVALDPLMIDVSADLAADLLWPQESAGM